MKLKFVNWVMVVLFGTGTWGLTSLAVRNVGWSLGAVVLGLCVAGALWVIRNDYRRTMLMQAAERASAEHSRRMGRY